MRSWIVGLAALVVLVAVGQVKAVVIIDFESDTTGLKPNGFTSADSPLVHFSDSYGSDLNVQNFGVQSHGQGLAVSYSDLNDPSYLIMDMDVLMTSISLDFGDDDPRYVTPGDPAILTVFQGGSQVGQSVVGMNGDDIMNQSISFSGAAFDQATFVFSISGWPYALTEVVDNINLTPIPEPSTFVIWSLLATLGIAAGWWRRKRAA